MDWRYEQEVRKVLPLHDRTHPLPHGHRTIEGDVKAVDNPSLVHLHDIPKELITGIILGWKSNDSLRNGVLDPLRSNGTEKVQVMRAEPCRKEYRMRIFSATTDSPQP
jgi:hypothetical protein